MPHYSPYEFSEPNFSDYESYYLTWYDENYGDCGPYGEPLPLHPEEVFQEPSTPEFPEENDFTGRFWNEYGLLTGHGYPELQLSYDGGNNWQGECLPDFDGHWKEDICSHDRDVFDKYRQYVDSLGKAEDPGAEQYHDYQSYNDDDNKRQPTYDIYYGYNSWFGDGVDEDCSDFDMQEYESSPSASHSSYETRLCQRIFGYWPCLSSADP